MSDKIQFSRHSQGNSMCNFMFNKQSVIRSLILLFLICIVLTFYYGYSDDQTINIREMILRLLPTVLIFLICYVRLRESLSNLFFDSNYIIIEYPLQKKKIQILKKDIVEITTIKNTERDMKKDGGVSIKTKTNEYRIYWVFHKEIKLIKRKLEEIRPIQPYRGIWSEILKK